MSRPTRSIGARLASHGCLVDGKLNVELIEQAAIGPGCLCAGFERNAAGALG